jgi:hypothetical protein
MYGSSSAIEVPDPYYLILPILTVLAVLVGSVLVIFGKEDIPIRTLGSLMLWQLRSISLSQALGWGRGSLLSHPREHSSILVVL